MPYKKHFRWKSFHYLSIPPVSQVFRVRFSLVRLLFQLLFDLIRWGRCGILCSWFMFIQPNTCLGLPFFPIQTYIFRFSINNHRYELYTNMSHPPVQIRFTWPNQKMSMHVFLFDQFRIGPVYVYMYKQNGVLCFAQKYRLISNRVESEQLTFNYWKFYAWWTPFLSSMGQVYDEEESREEKKTVFHLI